jgi:poly(A) polymerase
MKLDSAAEQILKTVGSISLKTGIPVYAVGGFVRDLLLDKRPLEIDFVVVGDGPALAREVKRKIRASGLTVFERFGTASILHGDYKLEFVTARTETYEEHSRKPVIEETDLATDLSRRDFTINTLAMDLGERNFGRIIDLHHGRADLKRRIIRTPLDPERTFSDDPLRIMRAARFASQLGFRIESETLRAMTSQCRRLEIVSQERITDELLKILSHPKPSIGFRLLQTAGVLDVIFPELSQLEGVEQRDTYHHKDVFEHTLKVLDNVARVSDNILLRFSALMHDIGKPRVKNFVKGTGWTFYGHELVGERMLKGLCRRLRLPKEYCRYSQKMTRLHMRPIQLIGEEVTDSAIRRLLVQAGEEIDDLMILCRADITSGNPHRVRKHLANFDSVAEKMVQVEEKDRMRAFQSPVRGDEIMELCGIGSGPLVGRLKKLIEEAILEGHIPNEHEAAYEYLVKIKDRVLEQTGAASGSRQGRDKPGENTALTPEV